MLVCYVVVVGGEIVSGSGRKDRRGRPAPRYARQLVVERDQRGRTIPKFEHEAATMVGRGEGLRR